VDPVGASAEDALNAGRNTGSDGYNALIPNGLAAPGPAFNAVAVILHHRLHLYLI
jgi:hypothetical protein